MQAGYNQVRIGSTGSYDCNLVLDNAAGGNNCQIFFEDAGTAKWELFKTTGNQFALYDIAGSKTFLNATSGGALTLGPNQSTTISQAGVVSFGTHSIGTNGYTPITDGLIKQWGKTGSISSGGGTAAVTFPTTFPNNVFGVQLTWATVPSPNNGINAPNFSVVPSTTGFTVQNNDPDSSAAIYWEAIGN